MVRGLPPLLRIVPLLVPLLVPLQLAAQNPDLALTEAERDSVLATYDQIFPIWGRKAIERGFDLPAPFGFNVAGFTMNQDLHISNLGLGFNAPPQPVGFITFSGAEAKVTNWSMRADLWLFPFLNVYTLLGTGPAQTSVHLATPVQFTSVAKFKGSNFGLGVTGAFGFRRNFVVVDYNHQWAFSSLLDAPVPANILSMRYGKAFRVGARPKRMRATFWVGTMFQSLKSGTSGSIKLSDALPPGVDSLFNNYQSQPWYLALGPAEQALVDNFVQRLQGGLDTTVVNYSLNKKVADPWNLLLGGTFDVGRHWGFRAEVGFVGRTSFLGIANYRITF